MKFYEGPSLINGDDIIGYVSSLKRPSTNGKTGDMVQSGCIVKDEDPLLAQKTGRDEAVCGQCPMRPIIHGNGEFTRKEVDGKHPCYVPTYYKKQQYLSAVKVTVDLGACVTGIKKAKKPVRLGEYGNMSAVPKSHLEPIIHAANGHTGYEQRWEDEANQWLKEYFQASVQTLKDAQKAWDMGWGTFRQSDTKLKDEIWCLYHKNKTQCSKCLLCDGKHKIVIPNHS